MLILWVPYWFTDLLITLSSSTLENLKVVPGLIEHACVLLRTDKSTAIAVVETACVETVESSSSISMEYKVVIFVLLKVCLLLDQSTFTFENVLWISFLNLQASLNLFNNCSVLLMQGSSFSTRSLSLWSFSWVFGEFSTPTNFSHR